jgi:hypothetical protein
MGGVAVGCARADSALAGSDDDVGEEVLLWQVISGGRRPPQSLPTPTFSRAASFGTSVFVTLGISGRTGWCEDGRGSRNRYLMLDHAAVQATASSDSS